MPKPQIDAVAELEAALSKPSDALVEAVRAWSGDLIVLGAGGKMGPTLCKMAARAYAAASHKGRVIAVSRFSDERARATLEAAGVQTLSCDLLDPQAVAKLPDAPNLIFMAGRKFGSTGAEATTWAINTFVPGLVASRFRGARVAVFSSGNVYPLVPAASGGCAEEHATGPIGEYAQSVLGRERMFEYFSREGDLKVVQIRLNYAVELRYGVLVDIAQKVAAGASVDVSAGFFNVIWQRDANEYALRALDLAASPAAILNVAGPETVSTRWAAQALA
ncbi:MAG TPA: NAD-dependent epimerase/dehydratase family protein, partial [Limnochordia bacterium]|nr:NAD-dependent epimerase/dehydratase family protein [Limnochordia bacterium]